MIKRLSTVILVVCALAMASVPARAQMSDDAVVSYVKEGMAAGKSQNDMAKELVARGVTKAQMERLRDKYQGMQQAGVEAGVQQRGMAESFKKDGKTILRQVTTPEGDGMSTVPVNPLEPQFAPDGNIEAYIIGVSDSLKTPVYGRNIFTNRNLSFAPSTNLPTPKNYRLGPGDEVIIDIWGTNQANIRKVISPEGTISIPDLGIVNVSGMTVNEADSYLRRKLGQIYSVDGENAQSDIKLSLGNIRTIQVNVMGEVAVPGTYHLSSLSDVYHALYSAGGVSDLGSLRDIRLVRNGKTVATVDVYDFIMNGKAAGDVALEEGDLVIVPPYRNIVDLTGSVKRPMKYEMKEGETVQDIVDFAGGFAGNAYSDNVRLIRKNGKEYQVYTIDAPDYASFALEDGDEVAVGEMLDRYSNKLEIKGAVYRPGIYQLGGGVKTLTQLIAKADGLMGDAFTNRGLIHRVKDDLTLEVIPFDVKAVLNGSVPDIELIKNDVVYIPSIHDIKDMGTLTIAGEVASPGEFPYAANTTLEDLIIQAGGLLESASLAKVDVTRRLKDPYSSELSDTLSRVYTFAIKEDFAVTGSGDFILQPYDQIDIRKSPKYENPVKVTINGQVVFPGTYSLTQRSERISDLVRKAGGVNQWAYVKGTRLSRELSPEEKSRLNLAMEVLDSSKDSVDVSMIEARDRYFVGIDLEAALANPGGEADIVLREGDIVAVPEYINTVKISGNVMYHNTVTYNEKMTVKDYVTMAGGYGFRAKRSKAYVVYMNGTVARARKGSRAVVEPGCEIIVPNRRETEGNLEKVLGIATTASSLATMMATIGNLLR